MMNEAEFRARQIERDNKSLDGKVNRWGQIVPCAYNTPLPKLVWGYIVMADDMYIAGYFVGSIFLCASIAELVISSQIVEKTERTSKQIEHLRLKELIELGEKSNILDNKESSQLDELRQLRNFLIHGNTNKLNKMAKRRYSVVGGDDSFIDADFYINSGFSGGIDKDAFSHLKTVRDLTVRFYGNSDKKYKQ